MDLSTIYFKAERLYPVIPINLADPSNTNSSRVGSVSSKIISGLGANSMSWTCKMEMLRLYKQKKTINRDIKLTDKVCERWGQVVESLPMGSRSFKPS